jgi:hypothetical protein
MKKHRFLGVARYSATKKSITVALGALKELQELQDAMALGGSMRAAGYGRSSLHEVQAEVFQYADVCEALAATAKALGVSLSDLTIEMACGAGYIELVDDSERAA